MTLTLRFHRTDELLDILRRALARMRSVQAMRARHVRLGDDTSVIDEAAGWLEHAITRGHQAAQTAITATMDSASTPAGWAYGKLKTGANDLSAAATALQAKGFAVEAQVVDELRKRAVEASEVVATAWTNAGKGMGSFLREVGTGAGDGLRNALPINPTMALIAGLVVLSGFGYLLLTPAGQALVAGGGKAVAAGGGELLAGGGRALGSLAVL